jgi:hypothetical protein
MCTLAFKFMNACPKRVQKLFLLRCVVKCPVRVLNSKGGRRGKMNTENTQGLWNSTSIVLNFIN